MPTSATRPVDLDTAELLRVLNEFKRGNFDARMPDDWTGIPGKVADMLNEILEANRRLRDELGRVGRVVGKEGRITQRASAGDLGGGWARSVESVNDLIEDLVRPTAEMSRVIEAVAAGDLSQKISTEIDGRPLQGQFMRTARTVNTMVDQLNAFASEVTRVAREVGTEGQLGGQAKVKGVGGVWKDLTDNVNQMAANLTSQVRNIAEVTTAVANGDLSKKITVEGRGEILELKDTINQMVDQLNTFAGEVTRVAREVGTEGNLGGQAEVKGVGGVWKDLTDNVNLLAGQLTNQIRNIAEVTTAVANGDLSKKVTVDVQGEILELKNTINTMVDQLNAFASEVTRVAREVGTEGQLGGQARVKGVSGTWKDLTDNVNQMAANLTGQVRNIAEVTTAVANGDLSKKITVEGRGEILELKDTINQLVDQLNTFAGEVTRVAREVGTEGKLGGQAEVKGVGGVWKDLTDNVNLLAGQLTNQIRNIAEVTTAVATGDLSKKVTVDVQGEILELKNTINVMVDQLNSFASEVTRVAREVGTEGMLGGQADVRDVSGTWKDLTDSVNSMAANLTAQVRNIADVTTAVANGDLSKKITVEGRGEILELKNTINVMVDQLNAFASEVTRVAREVGTEGELGGQAQVAGVSGVWEDLTDNVNLLAANLTGQVRNIAEVTTAVANGDLSKKVTVEGRGEILELKNTINTMVDQLNSFASEVTRVAREVGTEGKLGGQANVRGVAGVWKDLTDSVNLLAGQLTNQIRNIAEVTTAVANGDLSKKVTVDVQGEILELKNTINTMVDQLNAWSGEVTRVAREVGTEGKLGGQAAVKGVTGTWKELTDNVNQMAANLTEQVRGIALVVTAVANGDMKKKLSVDARGEVADLANTINEMTDTLAIFADQVTTVAREVGVEGKLGGQASVPGAAGTWRDLTDNVNQLAANLTTQLRAIADVATSVTEGELSREIGVEASGEVALVKDKINQMIRNLRETTQKNAEQDWLKTNIARFTRVMQGQRDLNTVSKLILSELAPLVNAQHGVIYTVDNSDPESPTLVYQAGYAFRQRKHLLTHIRFGEGLIGQCAVEKERILLTNVPEDYVEISSGLGESSPRNIVVVPVLFEGQVRAVIELSSLQRFSPIHQDFLDQLTESIGIVLNTIEANMRTEELLKQSQSLANELQSQQQELQATNDELQQKARLLAEQNAEVERKNLEVEQARRSLEEKAEQLEITSRYKSEFLANMSHELRTPLNSLLILAQQLADNRDGNLTSKQIEFAQIIRSSGQDLLNLINDILDLSKIESGTVVLDVRTERVADIKEVVEKTFQPIAESRGLEFRVEMTPELPTSIETDVRRLEQVLKNLLSNAFKFTERGGVVLRIKPASSGWTVGSKALDNAGQAIVFEVQDTGIGIPLEKQQLIFEAFAQADGSTARKYGGTGLGLNISRELVRLLHGDIKVESTPGHGATFSVYLPLAITAEAAHLAESRLDSISNGAADKARRPENVIAQTIPEGLLESPKAGRSSAPHPGGASVDDVAPTAEAPDDRSDLQGDDRVVLILEDDERFAQVLRELAHRNGFKALIALSGAAAVTLAKTYQPSAITLDLTLRDMSGWTVLDRLKKDRATRDIPVHIISVYEDDSGQAAQRGADSYLTKPVEETALQGLFARILTFIETGGKRILIVEDDPNQRERLKGMIGEVAQSVEVEAVGGGREALAALKKRKVDCIVLDLGLPDVDGHKLIDQIQRLPGMKQVPIVVYTAADLQKTNELIGKSAGGKRSIARVIQKTPDSDRELLDEIGGFFKRISQTSSTAVALREPPDESAEGDLNGRHVLIVDDDVRNIFALTALMERQGVVVLHAETGREAIQLLHENPSLELVLMDIMMPDMDGYETIAAIRRISGFEELPIIALTAKAMAGDRELCLEAGASDYLAKPVDAEHLLASVRSWLKT